MAGLTEERGWGSEFQGKWHAALSRTTKKALCGFETGGSFVWDGGNRRNWESGRWDLWRPITDDPGTSACGRCKKSLERLERAEAASA